MRSDIIRHIIIICFMLVLIGNNTNAKQNVHDIFNLAESIEKQNGTIIEWSLYARENVPIKTENDVITLKNHLRTQFSNVDWIESDEQLTGVMKSETYKETITFIHGNHLQSSYIVYEIEGSHWNREHVEHVIDSAYSQTKLLFRHQPVIFSCIKGEFSDNLNDFTNRSLNEMLQSLQANQVESLEEDEFFSISAYSSLFSQDLKLAEQSMNVQIGLRQKPMEAGTTIVVGTPIITIEY